MEGRNEAALEAERERPVKAPLRVSRGEGEPIVSVDPETRKRSGIETMVLTAAPYQEQVRAYVTVLDVAPILGRPPMACLPQRVRLCMQTPLFQQLIPFMVQM